MNSSKLPLRVTTQPKLTPEMQKIDDLNVLASTLRETDTKRALEIAQTVHALAQESAYKKGAADALVNISHCHIWFSNFPESLSTGLEALKQVNDIPGYTGRADLYLAIARSHLYLSNFAEAASWGQYAQLTANEDGLESVEADALNTLGVNYYRLEQFDRTIQSCQQALSLYRSAGDHRGACKAFVNLAEAHSKLDQHDRALELAGEALRTAREIQTGLMEAYALHTLGQMYANKGAFREALEPLEQSLLVAREVGNQYVPLVSLNAMGQVYNHSGDLDSAEKYFRQALALAEQLGNKLYTYRCHEALAGIHERRGNWQEALTQHKLFHEIKELVFNEQNMARIQSLEVVHQLETARKETEFYQQRNADLEREITRRIKLEKELQQQAATDALTGVANRRRFMETATNEIIRAVRHKRPLALAVIDLDHFKQINDTCGHAVGDQSLKTLAGIVKENIRPTDIFARFGGDEFVLLLLETDGQQAYTIIERIRQLVNGKVVKMDNASVSITISVGIAALTKDHTSLDNLLARADEGLYKAKHAGRNCVFLAEDS